LPPLQSASMTEFPFSCSDEVGAMLLRKLHHSFQSAIKVNEGLLVGMKGSISSVGRLAVPRQRYLGTLSLPTTPPHPTKHQTSSFSNWIGISRSRSFSRIIQASIEREVSRLENSQSSTLLLPASIIHLVWWSVNDH